MILIVLWHIAKSKIWLRRRDKQGVHYQTLLRTADRTKTSGQKTQLSPWGRDVFFHFDGVAN